ncbi:permease prefix domain 1-containing protein [Allokutzneria oryzae]|uniref:Permease prefix domain 1-containing protein n=1 Tax=Allokutzneria oryzae TaxID=1378989 RepID=A0ABV6A2E5_9PSEU
MAGQSLIDDYISRLGARLDGPRSTKDDLLAEARHGLEDAALGYRDAGFPDSTAQARAVADFGPLPLIADEYQEELAVAQGSHTVRSLLVAMPLIHVLWEGGRLLFLERGPVQPAAPSWFPALASAVDHAWVVVAVLGAIALVAGPRLRRCRQSGRSFGRLAGSFSTGALTACVVLQGTLIAATAYVNLGLLLSPAILATLGIGLVVMARLVGMTRRCFTVSAAA